MSRHAIH